MQAAALHKAVSTFLETSKQTFFKVYAQGITKISEVTQKVANFAKPQVKERPCAFCDKEVINRQCVLEDRDFYLLADYAPIMPGHLLVVAKRNVERFEELTDLEFVQYGRLVQRVKVAFHDVFEADDYIILQKNGKSAGQTVPHMHVHLIPTKAAYSRIVGEVKTLFRIVFGARSGNDEALKKTVEQFRAHFHWQSS